MAPAPTATLLFPEVKTLKEFEPIDTLSTAETVAERAFQPTAALSLPELFLFNEIKKTANELFIPFGVGGGVKTLEDFSKLFNNGADKVAINTYAVHEDPEIINKAAQIFGNQAVVVNIEAKKWDTHYECFTDCGRIKSGRNVIEWADEVESRGAGEILLQSVDADGRRRGFDIDLAKQVVENVKIPVVVSSGAGKLEDIKELIEYAQPSGVAIASLLHYDLYQIKDIKNYLRNNNIQVSI